MGHSTKLVRYLVSMMSTQDLELQNEDGNTAFCIAAISGNIGMVKIMFEKNRALPLICGSDNMMPLYLAAFHGRDEVVRFLYKTSNRKNNDVWTNDNMDEILLKCIHAGINDVALRILEDNEQLPQDKHGWDVLQVLAGTPEAFHENTSWITTSPIKALLELTRLVIRLALVETDATLLLRLILKRIMKRPKNVIDEIIRGPVIKENNMETYPSQILFIAAKMNNKFFLVELIREYPDLVWNRNDDGQTIFHIAVSCRHQSIFSILNEIGSMKDLITPITDNQGNNILHLAGKNPEQNALGRGLVAPPFQIHNEIVWYKEVADTVPPPCRKVKNAQGQTPPELFIENHTDLASKGAKWIHETINISMVVAVLVCTIGFSVAYTVPGGFDQNNGFPMFLQDKYFLVFIVADAISFILSTSSILMFLSIILSHRHGNMELLLSKWMAGKLALFISIVAIAIVFGISSFILYRNIYKSSLPYSISASGGILLILYATLQFSLYRDVIVATYNPRHFFGLNKHILYRATF
ncbi:putative ankyrin repeat-containing domain, PGG domain, ankyrin repeat-containing domain superfamily [Helianthus debilis subsp. tardiflorus]